MTLFGPIVGGLLVDTVSWRAAFLINLPVAALALWATWRHMAESRAEEASGRFDWLGAAVAVLAVGGLSFGLIRGEDQEWQDPVAWAALAIGLAATIAFPLLMARRRDPLVPPALFRRRAFATINLSTFLIYGALYTTFTIQALFLQGVLGYTATAAGIVGLPVGIFLTLLSTRVGTLAGRFGARPFLVLGPGLMAAGMFWFARIPSTSAPWQLTPRDPATFVPPASAIVDVLPFALLFGLGISMVVAPLTATLMSSVPVANAGVASAINNAVSRIGQPLLIALIFIVVTGTFYASLAAQVPGLDASDPAIRELVQPLNEPKPGTPPEVAQAATVASTGAFRLAAIVCGLLLLAGAAVNALGLRGERAAEPGGEAAGQGVPGTGHG
jgi:predicted MFS family arabinose efflux permease